MYEIVKTKLHNINGENVWLELRSQSETMKVGDIQQGTLVCKSLNETCEPDECYHLRYC